MKAIILAAGEGKRMRPLTLTTPKPMIEVLGKPLLHHIIDSLPKAITELILVVGYKADVMKRYFGDSFEGRKITYVFQEKPLGSAHALYLSRSYIGPREKFLLMFADDLHSKAAIEKLLRHDLGLLVAEHTDPRRFGVVHADQSGHVVSIEEKPERPKSNLVVVGVYVFDGRIFNYELVKHPLGEYFLPEVVTQLLKDHRMVAEKTNFWHPIGYPEDIEAAEAILKKKQGLSRGERSATPVIIIAGGKGTRMPDDEKDKPKVLVEVAGKSLIQWQIDEARQQGFWNITLSLGYKAEKVVEWLKASGNTEIRYVVEPEPLGTGGGLKLAAKGIREPFLAMNSDDLADVNLSALIRHGGDGAWNVLSGKAIADVRAFGLLKCDEDKKVCAFEEKNQKAEEGGVVNIGHYYLLPEIFEGTPNAFSLEHDIFPKLAGAGKLLLYKHTGYWLPTGTPEELKATREYFAKSH